MRCKPTRRMVSRSWRPRRRRCRWHLRSGSRHRSRRRHRRGLPLVRACHLGLQGRSRQRAPSALSLTRSHKVTACPCTASRPISVPLTTMATNACPCRSARPFRLHRLHQRPPSVPTLTRLQRQLLAASNAEVACRCGHSRTSSTALTRTTVACFPCRSCRQRRQWTHRWHHHRRRWGFPRRLLSGTCRSHKQALPHWQTRHCRT
mmetsp:Transcript_96420/g.267886  ORF Transcript_96420/g.267886 Transcript_96420/m.267886 type:complete len:205 (+) Transcript_96420:180-794(+)